MCTLALISAYLVLDDHTPYYLKNAKAFLRAVFVQHKVNQNKIYPPSSTFVFAVSKKGRNWTKARFTTVFPTVKDSFKASNELMPDLMTKLLDTQNVSLPQRRSAPEVTLPPTLQKEYGVCRSNLDHLLKMSGLNPGEEHMLSSWHGLKIFQKRGFQRKEQMRSLKRFEEI